MFVHCPPTILDDLSTKNIDGKRHYVTPKGNYASITTLLGSFGKQWIYEWRKRVGEEEANRISAKASSKGTRVHSLCEKYLNNESVSYRDGSPESYEAFVSLKPLLNKINNIHYLECALYSDRLMVAGRCDAIAEYEGILSIIDYKTSRRLKDEDDIEDYFLQATFYAMAYYELTGIKINQIVILMSVDDNDPLIFVKNINNYIQPLIKKIRCYHSKTI